MTGEPTIFWHLSCASLKQQSDPPASRLDEFNGTGVSHVPSAVAVNLYDLIPYLAGVGKGGGTQSIRSNYVSPVYSREVDFLTQP